MARVIIVAKSVAADNHDASDYYVRQNALAQAVEQKWQHVASNHYRVSRAKIKSSYGKRGSKISLPMRLYNAHYLWHTHTHTWLCCIFF